MNSLFFGLLWTKCFSDICYLLAGSTRHSIFAMLYGLRNKNKAQISTSLNVGSFTSQTVRMIVTHSSSGLSLVLCLTLGRSSTTRHPASKAAVSLSHFTPPSRPANKTSLKQRYPAWPISLPLPTSPQILQIPTLTPTWPLALEETLQEW